MFRKSLFAVIALLLVPALASAEEFVTENGQKKRLPNTEPYVSVCKSYQALTKPQTEIMFLKTLATNLDSGKKSFRWLRFVCPGNCDEIKKNMQFYKGDEHMSPGYSYDSSMFADASDFRDSEMNELLEKHRKTCKKALAANTDGFRLTFTGKEQECVRDQYKEEIKQKWNLGGSSDAALEKVRNKPFLDFYQVCYEELNKSLFQKKASDAILKGKKLFSPSQEDSKAQGVIQ